MKQFKAFPFSLPRTGQVISYYPGDDGDIRAGVPIPEPRFVDNGNQTITDNLTGLMWPKDATTPHVRLCAGGEMMWESALDYVSCLNEAGYLGYNDWRLPNINELQSLVDVNPEYFELWMPEQGFDVKPDFYWSSTVVVSPAGGSWVLVMTDGGLSQDWWSFDARVWPVRTGHFGAGGKQVIWATGQLKSIYRGDDGDIRSGAPWPEPRFTDFGDEVVTDNLTGLMWAKDADLAGRKQWNQALDFVAAMNLNAGTYGYNDWRLPNIVELRSLVDYSQHSPALQTGHPFINVQFTTKEDTWYWSSTAYSGTDSVWCVDMYEGMTDLESKLGLRFYGYANGHTWPVRSL